MVIVADEPSDTSWRKRAHAIAVPTSMVPHMQHFMKLCHTIAEIPDEEGVIPENWQMLQFVIDYHIDHQLQNYAFAERFHDVPDMRKHAESFLTECTLLKIRGEKWNSKLTQELRHLGEKLAHSMISALDANTDITTSRSVKRMYKWSDMKEEMEKAYSTFMGAGDESEKGAQNKEYFFLHEAKNLCQNIMHSVHSGKIGNAQKAAQQGRGYCLAYIEKYPFSAAKALSFFAVAEYMLNCRQEGQLFGFSR